MKKLFVLLFTVGIAACSSGGGGSINKAGGGSNGQVTEFGQKMSGTWVSECAANDEGNYKETLLINANGTGQSTMMYFANAACLGGAVKTIGPTDFTFTAQEQGNGLAQLTLVLKGQTTHIEVSISNNVMDVRGQNGQGRYIRIKSAQSTPGGDDFDRLAMGIWVTNQCYPYDNNTSARQQLTIHGRGLAWTVLQAYPSQNCSGRSRAGRPVQAKYTVTNFANGRGQITVNSQVSDVLFEDNRMTMTDADGSTVYIKAQ